jgi:hypothetical protein
MEKEVSLLINKEYFLILLQHFKKTTKKQFLLNLPGYEDYGSATQQIGKKETGQKY